MSVDLPAHWTARTLPAVRRKLLAWFDRHRRELPWRQSRDPYRVWVSEVMLQQTTVAAVVPFFERFLAAFPDVQSLAAADEQDVLKLWAGLGYYRRARHLHRAAQQIVSDHGGTFPDDPAAWAELPGVGRYILGAVLSQAFERRLPIVEANSLRVLARLFGSRLDPRQGPGKAWVWAAAEAVLPTARVGDFNQAVMELGALVCTPARPACDRCPLSAECAANRDGLQDQIPPKKAAPAITEVREAAAVVRDGDRVLVCQRPAGARWAGMWEFPHGELKDGEDAAAGAARVVRELTGLTVRVGDEVTTVRHGVTRYAITMTALTAERVRGEFASAFYPAGRWVTVPELAGLPMGTAQRRVAKALTAGRPPGLFDGV